MSYCHTFPPRASRTQRTPKRSDRYEQHLSEDQEDTRQEPAVQQCSGYHVIPPNPTKNAKLKEIAQSEEERHRLHKESQREKIRDQICSHPAATVGGRNLSQEEIDQIRKQQERELKTAKIRRKEERETKDRERRAKEQEKYDEHKQQQREKAVRLAERKSVEDERRRVETRSKRLAYFDNLQS